MSNTESIPTGLYHIVVAAESGQVGNERLSRQGNKVTLLPPGAVPESDQVWQVNNGQEGIIIVRPGRIFPDTYLTYEGAPQNAFKGARIRTRPSEMPPNEWRVAKPGSRVILDVVGTDLGIGVAPYSPESLELVLSVREKLLWAFLPVNPY